MAWIESHQTLANHPKTRKLARLLGISKVEAIGHLHLLWWWSMDYAQDGCLHRYDDIDVAIAAEWDGDPHAFSDALSAAGFIDGETQQLHDWDEYAGRLIERRKADAERKREARARSVQRPSDGHPEDGARNRTLPNRTVQNPTEPDVEIGADAPPKTKRAMAMTDAWEPTTAMLDWACESLSTNIAVCRAETEKFIDHFKATGKPMKDWDAAWKNWMRRSREFGPARASPNGTRPKNTVAEQLFSMARGEAER